MTNLEEVIQKAKLEFEHVANNGYTEPALLLAHLNLGCAHLTVALSIINEELKHCQQEEVKLR